MDPSGFDADPQPSPTPTVDPPGLPARAVAHAAPAESGLDEESDERTLEEPGYGHGV
jgi:hypothetical protein